MTLGSRFMLNTSFSEYMKYSVFVYSNHLHRLAFFVLWDSCQAVIYIIIESVQSYICDTIKLRILRLVLLVPMIIITFFEVSDDDIIQMILLNVEWMWIYKIWYRCSELSANGFHCLYMLQNTIYGRSKWLLLAKNYHRWLIECKTIQNQIEWHRLW